MDMLILSLFLNFCFGIEALFRKDGVIDKIKILLDKNKNNSE